MILNKINDRFAQVPLGIRFGIVLSACIIFLSSGYLYWKNQINNSAGPQKPAKVQNVKGAMISTEDLIYAPGQVVSFDVDPHSMRVKTYFRLLYLKPAQSAVSRLHIDMQDTNDHYLVIQHPIFETLDWTSVANDQYTLYQKTTKYESVEQFLEAVPSDTKIIYDQTVNINGVKDLANAIELPDDVSVFPFTDYDYLLTTYHPPSEKDGFFVFETTLDTTGAVLTDKGKLRVQIYNLGIDALNPLFFKEIFVDFKQPAQIIYETQ